jgi:hypothetical protein
MRRLQRFGIATTHDLDLGISLKDKHADVDAIGRPAMITPHVCTWAL